MQYVYSAMVLYSAGKEITEDAITAILNAAGVEVDAAKVKALVASLEGIPTEMRTRCPTITGWTFP